MGCKWPLNNMVTDLFVAESMRKDFHKKASMIWGRDLATTIVTFRNYDGDAYSPFVNSRCHF